MLAPWKLNVISSELVPLLFVPPDEVNGSEGTHGPPPLESGFGPDESPPLGGVGIVGGISPGPRMTLT
jgi:hypothetical protein